MASSITSIVNKVTDVIGLASDRASSNNKPYKLPSFTNEDDAANYGQYIDKICDYVFNEYPDKQIAGFKYLENGKLNFLYAYEKDKDGNDIIVRYQSPNAGQFNQDKNVHETNIRDMLTNSDLKDFNIADNSDFLICFDKIGNITQSMPKDVPGRPNDITTKISLQQNDKGSNKPTFKINSDGQLEKQ
ncbi:MAG: hypothetical protein Q4P09_01735 [Phascolarctobacterium sp.]|nr:hypothetical protein [Phascolarctobacterium sp.]